MNCHQFQKVFSACIEGELRGEIQARAQQHLQLCHHCSRLLDAHRIGVTALGKASELAPPEDLFESVMSAVAVNSPRTFELRSVFQPRIMIPALSAALIVMMFTLFPKLEVPGEGIHPEFAVVDSTMDMINYQVAEQLASKENSQKMKAVRLATYSRVEDESGKSGVNRNPVIILSGISDYGE